MAYENSVPSVSKDRRAEFINRVWSNVLGRLPDEKALAYLVSCLNDGRDPIDYFLELVDCPEAIARRSAQAPRVHQFVPPGHFYSPIVNPAELRTTSFASRRQSDKLLSLAIDFPQMESHFAKLMEYKTQLDFPSDPHAAWRYYSNNDMFGLGDALILACTICASQPDRIVEVGSGFSSAVILDTIDRFPSLQPSVTFIEPYTDRLDNLLRHRDNARVKIIQNFVQEVPLSIFEELGEGDILFLDTTHIVKTGSDVNFELFEILPRLKSGVIVHFHDIFDGFEYPEGWIFDENRSWNENYIVRAFMMYNNAFEVLFANHAFAVRHPQLITGHCPEIVNCPGAGFWLRRR